MSSPESTGSSADPVITIFYGPRDEFHKVVGDEPTENLMQLIFKMDDANRVIRFKQDGDEDEDEDELPRPRPGRVVAESDDYASIQPHAITNFIGWVRRVNPEQLYLHNPPSYVRNQLRLALPESTTVSTHV